MTLASFCSTPARRGLSVIECALALTSVAVLVAITLPCLADARGANLGLRSNNNLWSHGVANAMYAADWNGALVSHIDNDMSLYGNSLVSALNNWRDAHGGGPFDNHPGLVLGWGPFGESGYGMYEYDTSNQANATLILPIAFEHSTAGFGSFRFANARGYREYLAPSFYAPVFYAPTDRVVEPLVEPGFDSPWEYAALEPLVPGLGSIPYLASYVFSPAAMYHPDVMANPSAGGFSNPWLIDHGFQSPGLFDARYANLKTLMIEHHWLQNAPEEPCNPGFEFGIYDGCEPYYFNHGMASAPNTLFFDLSVRELPNTEVAAADQALLKKTGYGLWSRDTPFGSNGYYNDLSYDTTDLAHHILTTDGILGRDTLSR